METNLKPSVITTTLAGTFDLRDLRASKERFNADPVAVMPEKYGSSARNFYENVALNIRKILNSRQNVD